MSTPDRITKLVPVARPVSLAGTTYPIWQFRIKDLALLQQYFDDEWDDPLDRVEERFIQGDLSEAERDDLLFEAHEIAEQGPPVSGSPEAEEKLRTMEGFCAFLVVALARSRPPGQIIPYEEVANIAVNITPAEFLKLRRVCYGTSSLREITAQLMGGESSKGGSGTWAEAIDHVARSHKGWTYEYIYSLTITEFVNARREGKPVEEDISKNVRPDQEARYEAHLARRNGKRVMSSG